MLKRDGGDMNDEPPSGSTLIAKVYGELKNDIIRGRLTPNEKLRVEHLKRDYGVSGGTLREALTMLVADRLVEAEGQKGFRVQAISPEDLIDLNRIRILLEKEAIRQSVEHGDEDWEGGVVTAYHLLSKTTRAFAENRHDQALFEQWEERHRAFHLSLIAAAQSERLRYFLAMVYQQYERYRHLFLEVAKASYKDRDPHAEHAAILDAVLTRNGDLAASLIEDHVSRSIEEWANYFEQVGAIAAAVPRQTDTGHAYRKGGGNRKS